VGDTAAVGVTEGARVGSLVGVVRTVGSTRVWLGTVAEAGTMGEDLVCTALLAASSVAWRSEGALSSTVSSGMKLALAGSLAL